MADPITKELFREFFLQALSIAADNADKIAKKPVPRLFSVDLTMRERAVTSVGDAMEQIYAGDRFYKIIDVAVTDVFPERSIVFVRPDGQPDYSWDETWEPAAQGPFRQIVLENLRYPTDGKTAVSGFFGADQDHGTRCSFCGRSAEEAGQIIEGAGNVRICSKCIEDMHGQIQPPPKR